MICFSRFKCPALPFLTAVILLLAPSTLPAFPQPSLSIGSGNITGANYAVSSAIAKIFNRKRADYGMRNHSVNCLTKVPSLGRGCSLRSCFWSVAPLRIMFLTVLRARLNLRAISRIALPSLKYARRTLLMVSTISISF